MEIVIRSAVAFIILLIITRASGRGTLGELSAFDLLVFITMGDLIQQGITQNDTSLVGGLLAVGTMAALAVGFGYINTKWPNKVGSKVIGFPIVVINKGQVVSEALRRERISSGELLVALRQSGYLQVEDIEMGVLEPNGKFSFFSKEDLRS